MMRVQRVYNNVLMRFLTMDVVALARFVEELKLQHERRP